MTTLQGNPHKLQRTKLAEHEMDIMCKGLIMAETLSKYLHAVDMHACFRQYFLG